MGPGPGPERWPERWMERWMGRDLWPGFREGLPTAVRLCLAALVQALRAPPRTWPRRARASASGPGVWSLSPQISVASRHFAPASIRAEKEKGWQFQALRCDIACPLRARGGACARDEGRSTVVARVRPQSPSITVGPCPGAARAATVSRSLERLGTPEGSP